MDLALPLGNSKWLNLKTFGNNSAALPSLINSLSQLDNKFNKYFNEMQDLIYQQFTCSEAAFYVIPHLVKTGLMSNLDKAVEIWSLIGSIAATCGGEAKHLPELAKRAYDDALLSAEAGCLKAIEDSDCTVDSLYTLGTAAFGIAGHPLGNLVMDNYMPTGNAESSAECPSCKNSVYVAVFDSGLVLENDDLDHFPKQQQTNLKFNCSNQTSASFQGSGPWSHVSLILQPLMKVFSHKSQEYLFIQSAIEACSSGVIKNLDLCLAFNVMGSLILKSGNVKAAARYYHANDLISCVACGTNFVFANRWWGGSANF